MLLIFLLTVNYDSLQFLFSENKTTKFQDEIITFYIVQKEQKLYLSIPITIHFKNQNEDILSDNLNYPTLHSS